MQQCIHLSQNLCLPSFDKGINISRIGTTHSYAYKMAMGDGDERKTYQVRAMADQPQ